MRGDVARRHGSATRLGAGPSRAGPVRTPCAESPPPSCVRFQCVIKFRPWPEASSPHASSPRQSDRVGRKGETSRPTLRTGKRHTSGIGAREAEIAKATLPIGFCPHRGRKDPLRSLRPLCVLGVKTSRTPFPTQSSQRTLTQCSQSLCGLCVLCGTKCHVLLPNRSIEGLAV